MEEYIRLEEEKARRHGKVYNWETAMYGKIWRLGKGTVLENTLMCCVPDMAYGPYLIRRILEKLALAVEIDLTWSQGFVSVELGRLPNPLSCKTLLICPICISKILIEAP
ncbi:hypothetical protein Tco_0465554 [Tanacetum coccineum]